MAGVGKYPSPKKPVRKTDGRYASPVKKTTDGRYASSKRNKKFKKKRK